MHNITLLPTPYPDFKSYMKRFGMNLIYAVPAIGIVFTLSVALGILSNAAVTLVENEHKTEPDSE